MHSLESNFLEALNGPQRFLPGNADSNLYTSCITASKQLYSKAKSYDANNLTFLEDLVTEGFDVNQIWEQIQLLNEPALDYFTDMLDEMQNVQERDLESEELDEESENEFDRMLQDRQDEDELEQVEDDDHLEVEFSVEEHDNSELDDNAGQDQLEEYEEELDNDEYSSKKNQKKSVVDDEFFSLEEMEKFADLGEAQDMKLSKKWMKQTEDDSEEEYDENDMFSIGKDLATGDYEEDLDEDEDNANEIRYEDFFESATKEKPLRKTWRDRMEAEDDTNPIDQSLEVEQVEKVEQDEAKELFDDEEEEFKKNLLSSFEKEQSKMQTMISKFESENMAQKDWTMRGEVDSKTRPINSLLEEDLDVDIAVKPVPVITEETTATLADMIIQRIKDQTFDDVVRKAPPKDSVYDPNRRWELDDEKSKKSLSQMYEDEYQRQTSNAETKSERTLAVEKQHEEIDTLFRNLSEQLDALSNWHFTPKAATLDVVVVPNANVPAISLEEVIPANVSNAKLAHPKEIYVGNVTKSQAELDSADKKKLRTKAKRKASTEKRDRERAKKLQKTSDGLQENISKAKAMKQLMGQNNVTIVVDGKNKDKFKSGQANIVKKGDKIQKERIVSRPEMLRL